MLCLKPSLHCLQTPSFLGLLVKKLLEILVLMTMSPTVAFSSAPLVTHLAASLALPETVERVVRRAASLPPMATSSARTLATQNLKCTIQCTLRNLVSSPGQRFNNCIFLLYMNRSE